VRLVDTRPPNNMLTFPCLVAVGRSVSQQGSPAVSRRHPEGGTPGLPRYKSGSDRACTLGLDMYRLPTQAAWNELDVDAIQDSGDIELVVETDV